ncbi:hypothetical protein GCM10020219_088400 [Nonomuraea dietziae]
MVAGVGSTGTLDAIEQVRAAAEHGADVVMLLPPYLVKPSGSQVIDFFGAVAAEGGLPVMIQDAPAQTGVPMPVSLLVELLKLEGVESVKIETQPTAPKVGARSPPTSPSSAGRTPCSSWRSTRAAPSAPCPPANSPTCSPPS